MAKVAEREGAHAMQPAGLQPEPEGREGRRGQSEHRKPRAGGAFDPSAAGDRCAMETNQLGSSVAALRELAQMVGIGKHNMNNRGYWRP